jgi:hypothetical protein
MRAGLIDGRYVPGRHDAHAPVVAVEVVEFVAEVMETLREPLEITCCHVVAPLLLIGK